MSTNNFNIENIADFNIVKRKGIKRLTMRIKPNGVVSITCPWFVTNNELSKFIANNVNWIEKHKKILDNSKCYYEIGQTITTKAHTIAIISITSGTTRAVLKNNSVVITINASEDIKSEKNQLFIKSVITAVYRNEAKAYLPQRVFALAKEHNFEVKKVFVKNLKSKWGSCSSTGNINLNLNLMRMPDHLIDYIILHELAHTKEMNHGPNFWLLLNKITNNMAKQLDKEIKSQKIFFL